MTRKRTSKGLSSKDILPKKDERKVTLPDVEKRRQAKLLEDKKRLIDKTPKKNL